MFRSLKERLFGSEQPEEPRPYVPVIKDGMAKISEPEQIPEPYCDITAKDVGQRYLGMDTGTVYIVVKPWQLDG